MRALPFLFAVLLSGLAYCSETSAVRADAPVARVQGTDLSISTSDDTVLRGPDLAGAILTVADLNGLRMQVRINSAQRDPQDPAGRRWLFALSSRKTNTGVWQEFCEPGPEGKQLGFPVAGTTTDGGSFNPDPERFSFTCTSGAVAKCIRFGYAPWDSTADGTPLLDHFRACMRMVRADYCGDGRPHTRDGTLINLYDRLGIQVSEPRADLKFEAAWGPDGAICVRKTRLTDVFTMEQLRNSCGARLAEHLGQDCNLEAAMSQPGALLFNDSRD
jgi:hypothetical protein